MRRRPWFWLTISIGCFVVAAYLWQWADRWAAQKRAAAPAVSTHPNQAPAPVRPQAGAPGAVGPMAPVRLLSQAGTLNAGPVGPASPTNRPTRLAYRLNNSSQTAGQLARSDTAVLLENALVDTTQPPAGVPEPLRAHGDPGSYIVQARGPVDEVFRALLKAAGAGVVAYIPNNAYLVRGSATVVGTLASQPQVQSILPYEPYYKLKGSLLELAVRQSPLPGQAELNLLLFNDGREGVLEQLPQLGVQVVSEERSPFGPVVKVRPGPDSLAALAQLSGVQELEVVHARQPANDLSRATTGVSFDPLVATNYLGLTGTNVLVNINDTGVDTNHPDLQGRVLIDSVLSGVDTNGHGTHVAGIIASSGSTIVSNVSSLSGLYAGTNGQFRGMAPGAQLYSLLADPLFGPAYSDSYLQETAAKTNAFISNNSWNYSDVAQFKPEVASYDLAAARYDAAVRDALPLVPGPQPLLFVFAAGDAGIGQEDGSGGQPDTILSPATAKNVITVGALELPRGITNQVAYDVQNGLTGQVYFAGTDTSNQVASFSSRGNVGIGVEGDFGRFKPDVVAPGTFVVSTRSGQWDQSAYYTTHNLFHIADVFLPPQASVSAPFDLPPNVTQLNIRLVHRASPSAVAPVGAAPFPDLPIFVSRNNQPLPAYDYLDTNTLTVVGPTPSATNWLYTVLNTSTQTVVLDVVADLRTVDPNDLTFQSLSNLNESLGGQYRYESGTSMAAGDVSGTLALIQQFLQEHSRTNSAGGPQGHSPALLKAMLINGAQSLDNGYSLQVQNLMNFQGWGLLRLPTSLHGGLADETMPTNSMWLVDQSPTNALATGDSHTYTVSLNPEARGLGLRVTLAWTDPPGNPIAGIKLVNDLDLVVTNLDSAGTDNQEVFFGNDIISGDYNLPWDTNLAPNIDFVNNVENVFIPGPLATNYSITIKGHRVNVNAVAENPDNVAQDYALVVACGDGSVTNALAFARTGSASANVPNLTTLTNTYIGSTNYFGQTLQNQRVGANPPLIGTNTFNLPADANALITLGVTNQWHFYVIDNTTTFTNARFVISNPRNLSVPREGVNVLIDTNATRVEADVDMYVTRDAGLLGLDPVVVSNALKRIGREGSTTLVISNAAPGVYYIGVKSEDQMAAEFTLQVLFSQLPFSQNNQFGDLLYWLDPAAIPDGSVVSPGITNMTVGPADPSMLVRRVIVSNLLSHELVGDLVGTLTYPDGTFCVLNNHGPDAAVVRQWYIYDDSGEGDVTGSRHTDGPGSLHDFAGRQLGQLFTFYMEDNALNHRGTNLQFYVFLERQQPLTNGVLVNIQPHHCVEEFIQVPPEAISMTVTATLLSGTGPVTMQVCQVGPGGLCSSNLTIGAGASLTLDQYSNPPLTPGTYVVRLCNNGDDPARVFVIANLVFASNPFRSVSYTTNPVSPILDDAVTYASITVTNHLSIAGLDVGLLINDPRISDLAITLISPSGKRILLFEDRGAASTNGLGTFSTLTNSLGVPAYGYTNMVACYTNNFDDVPTGPYAPGAMFDGWSVLSNSVVVYPELPAPWLSNNVLVLGYGVVSNNLPTTNASAYALSFNVTHAPYLVGTVGWWPLDGNGADIFSGLDGLLSGDVTFTDTGKVHQAFIGDGVGTRMVVPRCPQVDVGADSSRGFSIEGWINPVNVAGATNLTTISLSIPSTVPWTDTGIDITAGTRLIISASGLVRYGVEPGKVVDPNGGDPFGGQFSPFSVYPNTTVISLIGKIGGTTALGTGTPVPQGAPGNGAGFVGTTYSQVIPTSGRLFLGFNDHTDAFGDNSGSFSVTVQIPGFSGTPITEWNDPGATNGMPQGVQFWLSGLPGSNAVPGSLWANLWDTNAQPHIIGVITNSITNGGWQHVALTYDAATLTARLYTNGQLAAFQVMSLTNTFRPRTSGDLYFGYHPGAGPTFAAFQGGLDEFGLYNRALSDCEVAAIFQAQFLGKYGTNALTCPVTNVVQLGTAYGTFNYTFANGLYWTNGPVWETNVIFFTNALQSAVTNGPPTNYATLTITPLDPNAALDNFVLSALTTNFIDGMMHFTEDTNLAVLPIKFAPWPYAVSNFPPVLIFSNEFEKVTNFLGSPSYQAGDTLPGSTNDPAFGPRDWTVVGGPVTVISNSLADTLGGTNCVALAMGGLQCTLPTAPSHRYQLTYAVRGPGAVSWWNGEVEPLSRRAWDLLGGNHGFFFYDATNWPETYVGPHALNLPGVANPTNNLVSKIELGDPANLRLTNSFTIEGWIKPLARTNYAPEQVEQILYRGETHDFFDPFYRGPAPYYLGVERVTDSGLDLVFHLEDQVNNDGGIILETTAHPVQVGQWQHVAAVFETYVSWTNNAPWYTNELRLYLDGVQLLPSRQEVFLEDPLSNTGNGYNEYTGRFPFGDLDPSFSPGVSIGARSRYDLAEAFRGNVDELTVYGRALSGPEIAGIAAAGAAGKADLSVSPGQSLAKLSVSIDGSVRDVANGDNAHWTTRTIQFTALQTNSVLRLQSLLPGTLVDGITLTELPPELDYLPEVSLASLNGEDAYGTWQLEMWDTRSGPGASLTNLLATLLSWQLNFKLLPVPIPPVIELTHGIPYTNSLAPDGVQYFIVNVPQWATMATNILLSSVQYGTTNPLPVGVLFDTNGFPVDLTNGLFWPPVSAGLTNLSTNTTPALNIGQPYYLALTNTNNVSVTFAVSVWFDITPLTNCLPQSNFVWQAGIPRYFQFDVATNDAPPPTPQPQEVLFWLTGVRSNFTGLGSNLTVVLSQHLPLPDLAHYDYIAHLPSTNNTALMVLTNTTPFSIQTNTWYVGVFSDAGTNVSFLVQACYSTNNYPAIIPLTNGVPFVASFANPYVAPPGPPQWFFFEFQLTNSVGGVLFELYNLSGNADLVLQREVPPGMAPYFAGSFRTGLNPEQIVLRPSQELPDLVGHWYLGIFNNEATNVAYTLRAVTRANGLLLSAQPLQSRLSPMPPPHGLLLQWNSVIGEWYVIEFTPSLSPANWQPVFNGRIQATTPLTTFEVPVPVGGAGFYRVRQLSAFVVPSAQLQIQLWTNNQVRLSWSTNFPGKTVQFSTSFNGPWANLAPPLPITVQGALYVVYDTIGPVPRYYRLIP